MPDPIQIHADQTAKVILEHASRLAQPARTPDGFTGAPVILIPQGWKQEPVSGWEPVVPDRIEQVVNLSTVESFARYVEEFKQSQTKVFAEVGNESGKFVAVIDYHDAREHAPAWGRHLAIYTPAHSEEWKRWTTINKKAMSQHDFAVFLEDNLATVAEPSGADLLGIVNTIEVDGKVEFRAAQRLQDGSVRFVYSNDQKAKSGEMDIPTEFELRLPVFEGEPAFPARARFRYRLAAGEFKLWFELINPHRVVRDALTLMEQRIAKGTGIVPLRGSI